MPLDPYLAERIGLVAGMNWNDLPESGATARFEEFHRDPAPWNPPAIAVGDGEAPGPHGSVPVRIYGEARSPGTLLWMHGGAFAFGDLDMPESHVVATEIAARSGLQVVSVGYRLASAGVRFPVPLDDVVAAYQWVISSDRFAGPYFIGGASAGGSLALAAAISVRDLDLALPSALLLAYPLVHFPVPALDDEVAAEIRTMPPFTRFPAQAVREIMTNYVGRSTDLPVLAAPGQADLIGLPPVSVITCELDDLRASGDLLVEQLAESGVVVHTHLAQGMLHGHLNRTPGLDEVDRSLDFLVAALSGGAIDAE